MKILIISNKVKTFSLGYQNTISQFLKLGHELVWAADFSGFVSGDLAQIPAKTEQISINTNPLNTTNIKAYKQIKQIIDKHSIEGIYCTTPIGGALGRLAGSSKKIRPVVYSAHGFLFFKGAPLINRTVYKWEEVLLAHCTDAIITITEEDYQAAQKLKLRSGRKPYLVHGAGVNTGVKVDTSREEKRKSLDIPDDAFVIVSAGELNKNKNTEVIVRALAEMDDKNVFYLACGVGPEKENLEKLAKELNLSDRFRLLGYRTDMPEIMACADVFTMMSFREGMPRAVLEAMDLGLACVGSDTRGVRDLIKPEGGFICDPKDPEAFARAFKYLYDHPEDRKKMGQFNRSGVKNYSSEVVRGELYEIFKKEFA